MGKAVKKIASFGSKLTRSKFADPLGLSKTISLSPIEDTLSGRASNPLAALMNPNADMNVNPNAGLEAALRAQAAAARNANVDLGIDNVAKVEAGGTAEAQNTRRRRGGTGGVASSLGVRV